ncbi:glycosyltransferase [Plesiomonas shigelloides]|uniref:glycosyltransferase n=1 Tax=Plesiomonas shigelloides TaxID=703 RepID=UPI00387F2909
MSKFIMVSPFENDIELRGTRNIHIANELLSKFDEVIFVSSNFSHQMKRNFKAKELNSSGQLDANIRKVYLDVSGYKSNYSIKRFYTHWQFACKLLRLIKTLSLEQGDVVLFSSIPPEPLYFCADYISSKRAKLLCDVRDIWPDAFTISGVIGRGFSLYCDFFYSRVLPKVDSFTFVSPSFENWINRYLDEEILGVTPKKFLPLGYDRDRWDAVCKPVKTKSDTIGLCYIGFLESQFRLENIVSAFSYFNSDSLSLSIIGDGSKLDLYKSLDKNMRVQFLGRQPFDSASELVCKSDIGLLPIFGSAQMPNKLFDYIGAGIPVVCFPGSDSSKLISQYQLGWVVDNDESAFVDFFKNLSFEDVLIKKKNVLDIRQIYSKCFLYNPEIFS